MWTASPVTQSKVAFRASAYPDMGGIGSAYLRGQLL